MLTFHIVTLFPESLTSYIESSIIARAQSRKLIKVCFYNPRDFTKDRFARVDAKPYGGGPGMVLQAEPVIRAIAKAKGQKKDVQIIYLSPGGEQFDNKKADNLSVKSRHIVLVCGRYEGIDERVRKVFPGKSLSVGPYVVTGGELPAMVILDSVTRRLPGVLGSDVSIEERRVSSRSVFTRPAEIRYKGKVYKVPKVLRSGNHKDIDRWREGN